MAGPFGILSLSHRYRAIGIALAVGLVAFVVSLFAVPSFSIALGANFMFVAYLVQIVMKWPKLTPEHLKEVADEDDAPALVIFAVTATVVVAAILSLFLALNGNDLVLPQVALGMLSVLLGWFALHTLVAFHYAHEFYEAPDGSEGAGDGQISAGLEFPGGERPNGAAFLYFSYVVGMTAQVSDVQVTSNKMRWLVLWHGAISFWFNTVILAATVNAVIAVAGG